MHANKTISIKSHRLSYISVQSDHEDIDEMSQAIISVTAPYKCMYSNKISSKNSTDVDESGFDFSENHTFSVTMMKGVDESGFDFRKRVNSMMDIMNACYVRGKMNQMEIVLSVLGVT